MKNILMFLLIIVLSTFLSGCGYNKIMINHLSNIDNYQTYNVFVKNIPFKEGSDNTYIDVIFNTNEEAAKFIGVNANNLTKNPEDYVITLQIIQENNIELIKNSFYDNVKMGDAISVTVSSFIYQDTNYFYIIGVSINNIVFLDVNLGINNVILMMENNKSLF